MLQRQSSWFGCAQEIARFLRNPRKPVILAMSRPDAKKNITTLVKAFGENPTLRELANLVLIMVRFFNASLHACHHEHLHYCSRRHCRQAMASMTQQAGPSRVRMVVEE